jgi:hypothetical protein
METDGKGSRPRTLWRTARETATGVSDERRAGQPRTADPVRVAKPHAKSGLPDLRSKPVADLGQARDQCAVLARDLEKRVADHLPRDRVDRRLAGRDRQAGACDGADARAGAEGDAAAGRPAPHGREHQRAVRDVGVVAGVLDDAGGGGIGVAPRGRERKARPLAARQRDLDRIEEIAGEQRRVGGFRRRGRAGAGGPAAAQRAGVWHGGAYSTDEAALAFSPRARSLAPSPRKARRGSAGTVP